MTTANGSTNGRPGPVEDDEELGRSVLSGRQRRTAANSGVPLHVFLERAGEREISVDRLTLAPLTEIAANAIRVAAQRSPPRNFYGWAVVEAGQVRAAGYEAHDSPLPDNRYHADIVLPDSAIENADVQRQCAVTLAGMSKWHPAPYGDDV